VLSMYSKKKKAEKRKSCSGTSRLFVVCSLLFMDNLPHSVAVVMIIKQICLVRAIKFSDAPSPCT
jgi:hypothetical protein